MIFSHLLGETVAVTVSLLWTVCSIFFALAGKKVGVLSVNAVRIVMAIGLLGGAHIALMGTLVPEANQAQWFWMGLSGVVGLSVGDFCYFSALVIMGPRRGVLLMSTHPIFSAVVGYMVLGEVLGPWAILGIALTLGGVGWVILEREDLTSEEDLTKRDKILGTSLGIAGAAGQGIGLVISKYGMFVVATDPSQPLNPLSATFIRMMIAAIFFWIIVVAIGRLPEVRESVVDKKAMAATFGGAFFGPFLGVWGSMVAVSLTYAGIAATLMSLMPVMVIPIVWLVHKQRTTWRGFIGALVAFVGVAVLFLT